MACKMIARAQRESKNNMAVSLISVMEAFDVSKTVKGVTIVENSAL